MASADTELEHSFIQYSSNIKRRKGNNIDEYVEFPFVVTIHLIQYS
jgi:hypothetical protein